jgi:alpha-galactosidase
VLAPLPYFESNDPPDRVGITEMKYCAGLYTFWDRIRAAHPDLFVNTDHRLDLECVMRSHVIQMSDQGGDNLIDQACLYSIGQYLPNGGIMGWCARVGEDDYTFFSNLASSPLLRFAPERIQTTEGRERAQRQIGVYQAVRHLIGGDWYPLTPFSRDPAEWLASQYHRPDRDEGVFLAYRREGCVGESLVVCPQFLAADAEYLLTSLPDGKTDYLSGAVLQAGYGVTVGERPGAGIIVYRRSGGKTGV